MGIQASRDLDSLRGMARTLEDVLPLHILPETDKDELARSMRLRIFPANEVIYHRGDPAANANVVFSGLVKVMLLDENGHEALVALHGRGEFFGELALFSEEPREATVITVMPTQVFQLSRESCWAVLRRNAEASEFMMRELAVTIQKLSAKYESLVFLDAPGRLAKYLLELDHAGEPLPITQDDLAAAIGSTRFTVNKVLADYEKRGMIEVDRRSVKILDAKRLELETHR